MIALGQSKWCKTNWKFIWNCLVLCWWSF